jgi:hypothetical protein
MRLVSLMLEDLQPEDLQPEDFEVLDRVIQEVRRNFKASFEGKKPHPEHSQEQDKTFNLNFPNFSALLSIPGVLKFLGPTNFLDTMNVSISD